MTSLADDEEEEASRGAGEVLPSRRVHVRECHSQCEKSLSQVTCHSFGDTVCYKQDLSTMLQTQRLYHYI